MSNECAQTAFAWPEKDGRMYEFVGTFLDPLEGSDNHSTIHEALIEMIRSASERIFVASFLIGDERVIEELLRAAERRRGGVYVITALSLKVLERGLAEYEVDDSSPEERGKYFRRLTSGGIYVRGHEECHAKFAVFDDSVALIGSANFVQRSFEWSNEIGVVVRDAVQIRQAARLFTELWYEGCTWEIPPGRAYTVAERVKTEPPTRPGHPGHSENRLVWTNGDCNTFLLDAIQETIAVAKREIIVSSFSIVNMRENPSLVFEHLQRAIERGVSVRLLVRQRNAFRSQMADLLAASDMGIEIHGDTRNHAKVVISDRQVGVIFSANLDAVHGLTSGGEVGMRLEEPSFLLHLCRYFDHVISTANTTYNRDPTLVELDKSLSGRWRKQWPFESQFEIHGPDAEKFLDEAKSGVCLFEQRSHELWLYAGDVRATLQGLSKESGFVGVAQVESICESKPAMERLYEWMKSVHGDRKDSFPTRGFCPATISRNSEIGN